MIVAGLESYCTGVGAMGALHNGSCLAASSLHNRRNGISLEGDTEASSLAKLQRS